MSLEIERKFLVKSLAFKKEAFLQKTIKQGYLNSNKLRTVRIRITDDNAFLTIKGMSNASGTTRFEWEKEIDKQEAERLLLLCEPSIIDKKRYYVKNNHFTFEVDEFYGDNEGLIIAEIELNDENDFFEKPKWLGKEVTGKKKFYNAFLSNKPFLKWKKNLKQK